MSTDMKNTPTKNEVATLLDVTLDDDNRGPRTFLARKRLAEYLDLGKTYPGLKADTDWLAEVALAKFKPGTAVILTRVFHTDYRGRIGRVVRVVKSHRSVRLSLLGPTEGTTTTYDAFPGNLTILKETA